LANPFDVVLVLATTKENGMTNWEHRLLGAKRAPGSLTELEIDHFFTLRPVEKTAVLSRRGAANQVGLALMIGAAADDRPAAVPRTLGAEGGS
jgi:hypothetical protein